MIKKWNLLTNYHTMQHFDTPKIYSCGKHCEKRRNACNKQFLLFSQCFLPYMVLIFHFKCTLKCMDMKKFLKNLLLWNRWSDFEIISQECSLGDPFRKLFAKSWSFNKHGSCERGLFALYGHEEILEKSSQKLLVRFWNSFTEMFLEWPFSKIVSKILIRH